MKNTFSEVWYRPSSPSLGPIYYGIAYYDIGVLNVDEEYIEFQGRKGLVVINTTDINKTSSRKHGSFFITNWIKIEYGGAVAYFTDGTNRGWNGFFGGNRKMWKAVQIIKINK